MGAIIGACSGGTGWVFWPPRGAPQRASARARGLPPPIGGLALQLRHNRVVCIHPQRDLWADTQPTGSRRRRRPLQTSRILKVRLGSNYARPKRSLNLLTVRRALEAVLEWHGY